VPRVLRETPAAGASDAWTGGPVAVTFNESIQPTTLSFVLSDAAGRIVPAQVSYNDATRTATLTPDAPLQFSTTYTGIVSGAQDLAGNSMSSPVSWAFTTAAQPAAGGYSLFGTTDAPVVTNAANAQAVELGIRFASDVGGYITAIRFYKGTENTGVHVGHLWNANGQLLATATFSNETASGWQEVTFSQPVPVIANTVYIASYHTDVGHYSYTLGYFAGNGLDDGPLHAPSDGLVGSNGVYAWGASGMFPTQTYQSANYFVDVVFTTSAPAPAAATKTVRRAPSKRFPLPAN